MIQQPPGQRARRDSGRLARLTFEELEAAGICECGVPLEEHPPQPKRAQPLASSWTERPTFAELALNRPRGRPAGVTDLVPHQRRPGAYKRFNGPHGHGVV